MAMAFSIRAFDAPLGAEIVGLDLSEPLEPSVLQRVRQALLDHLVIVFRDARISPTQHIAFTRSFGTLQIHVLRQFQLAGHPEILVVSNVIENGKPIGLGDAGRDWHSDLSYKPRPSMGSLLHAQELPSSGGETKFANMYAAYETLPQAERAAVEGRRATHSYLYRYERLRRAENWRPPLTAAQIAEVPQVDHPAVRTHPETARKALYVNEGFTSKLIGLPDSEGREVLTRVFAHSVRDGNVYVHHWQRHDLVFWDNRTTIHYAAGVQPPLRRTLYRTTVEGDIPV
jgi:taurine dioxygenase